MSDEGDKYEHFNYDHDKHMYSGHSGKQRTKKEAEQHTNQHDVGGKQNGSHRATVPLSWLPTFTVTHTGNALHSLTLICNVNFVTFPRRVVHKSTNY